MWDSNQVFNFTELSSKLLFHVLNITKWNLPNYLFIFLSIRRQQKTSNLTSTLLNIKLHIHHVIYNVVIMMEKQLTN